jgi:hypothetical protein
VLLDLAGVSQLLALFFAMCIAILLGMGMPTTAAYAVAASVVAPGLVQLGIPMLTAHFFVFYFAVVSAITPPVALASYAAAGDLGREPDGDLGRLLQDRHRGLHRALHVLLQQRDPDGRHVVRGDPRGITATFGVFLLSSGVQGWFMGGRAAWFLRVGLIAAALFMIEGGWVTDLIGHRRWRCPTRSTPARARRRAARLLVGLFHARGHDPRAVNTLLRDRRFGREPVTPREIPDHLAPFYAVEAHSMLELEPPRHTRLRSLVLRAFTNRRIKALAPEIEALTHS